MMSRLATVSWRHLWIGVAVVALGCGDSSETTAGTAGAGGGGGAGGAGGSAAAGGNAGTGARGDSGGPVPPPAQGSVSLHLDALDVGTSRCAPGRQWINAPSTPTPIQFQQVSATDLGTRAVDGVEGNHVTCAVKKNGDKFAFSADITTPRTDGTQVLHPTVLHFASDAIGPTGSATGSVTVMSDTTGANYVDDQCQFSVAAQMPAEGLGVFEGRIWTSVTCEQLGDPAMPGDVCRINLGFLVFENCAQ